MIPVLAILVSKIMPSLQVKHSDSLFGFTLSSSNKFTSREPFINIVINQLKNGFNVRQVWLVFQKQPPRGVLSKRCSENMQQIYGRTPMQKCDFNKVAKATSAWVFSCKFVAYFQNTFSQKHLWVAASVHCPSS